MSTSSNIYYKLKSLHLGYVRLHSGQLYWGYKEKVNMVNFPRGDISKLDAHLFCFLVMTVIIYGVPSADYSNVCCFLVLPIVINAVS